MLSITNLKIGAKFIYQDQPYEVIWSQHTQMGRGGGLMKVRMKNLLTGATMEKTFKGQDSFEECDLERRDVHFVRAEGNKLYFVDEDTDEEIIIDKNKAGNAAQFLIKNMEVEILSWEDSVIAINLPIKISQKVAYTEPGVRGNTVSGATKLAELESGAKIQVPLFVNIDDLIIINTETGQYVERGKY